jgi:hypothetical protein
MTTPSTSRKLTIFEGPDGSGKSTAAEQYAKETGAKYVHFGPLPNVKDGLARMYVEAMLPALLGYQDVVFDRCWLSEVPYGSAFRDGADRLGRPAVRMLERLALRCSGAVVYCLPDWLTVRNNYLSRKEIEYLQNEEQLQHVYEVYTSQSTDLPRFNYDYTVLGGFDAFEVDQVRTPAHPLGVASAGNLNASIMLVGEDFAERKDQDPWYQWPFASFSNQGCSQWLTEQLDLAGISEFSLYWVNADQAIERPRTDTAVIALGTSASQSLLAAGIPHEKIPHPQSWLRFNSKQRYPLLNLFGAQHANA